MWVAYVNHTTPRRRVTHALFYFYRHLVKVFTKDLLRSLSLSRMDGMEQKRRLRITL